MQMCTDGQTCKDSGVPTEENDLPVSTKQNRVLYVRSSCPHYLTRNWNRPDWDREGHPEGRRFVTQRSDVKERSMGGTDAGFAGTITFGRDRRFVRIGSDIGYKDPEQKETSV